MEARARLTPSIGKVLLITVCWTLILVLSYVNSYLLIGDLVQMGKLSGSLAFWPDFAGNAILGVFGGVIGGSLLVFKVNRGYRHRTFTSGIVNSVVLFTLVFVGVSVTILFTMSFVFYGLQAGLAAAPASAWGNVLVNVYTPSFLTTTVTFGLIVASTQFMLQVNDKFGPGVLRQFISGKYYHPRDEERIFMFLDLRSSTEIAEVLGSQRFFQLLRELFQDITRPVIDSRGDIYQYVGDEVVITWPVERGFRDANCIACFFLIERALAERRGEYLERFGVAPHFKAGVHVGTATVGEIGVIKKDIVYSGDVLNTTSRIQQECNRLAVDLLVSRDLLDRMPVEPAYETTAIGEIQLRGKAKALALSAVLASERGARPTPQRSRNTSFGT